MKLINKWAQEAAPSPTVGGGASGDPHLVGGNGAKYVFAGQSGGIYSFFSSPWYQVAVQLSTGTLIIAGASSLPSASCSAMKVFSTM